MRVNYRASRPIEIGAAERVGYYERLGQILPHPFVEGFTMQVPLQIAFDGIQHSDAVEARIKEEVGKLEQFSDRILSARVVVARPQHRHHKGDIFHIRVHLVVPDAPDIVVSREPAADGAHQDVYVTIRDAFKAARRQLQDVVRKQEEH
jgi:ribosome-associated translation inhibitor RaiA